MDERLIRKFLWEDLPSYSRDFCLACFSNFTETYESAYCELCQKQAEPDVNDHCRESKHEEIMEMLISSRTHAQTNFLKLLQNATRFDARIKQLGLDAWKNDLRIRLVPYHELSIKEDSQPMPCIEADLKRYEFIERTSLLELVAWKIAIFLAHREHTDMLDFLAFVRNGWKAHKNEQRHHSSVAVIVRRVMPFLEQP